MPHKQDAEMGLGGLLDTGWNPDLLEQGQTWGSASGGTGKPMEVTWLVSELMSLLEGGLNIQSNEMFKSFTDAAYHWNVCYEKENISAEGLVNKYSSMTSEH